MYLLHTIQRDAVEDMKTRECEVFNQLENSKNTIAPLKNKVKETKKKTKTLQDDMKQLDEVVTLTYDNFSNELITPEMFSEDKKI